MVLIVTGAILVTMVNFYILQINLTKEGEINGQLDKTYSNHFALIYDGRIDEMWNSIYESANAYGNEHGVYVEMLGANMPDGYSKEQLMEIAILSDVDGIIVEGDDSEKLITLIAEAEENGIPVVTVMSDADKSRRKSFIGISSYDVGIEFGKQLINYLDSDKDIENIMILLGSGDAYSSQHTMYLGILECISQYSQCVIDVKLLDNTTAFSTDEAIRDILVNLEEEPEIMICLSEEITESAYQSIVEYNKVGIIDVMGFASTNPIYKAVDKGLIQCVISLDEQSMGGYSVEALLEHKEVGYVSEYRMVDTTLVTKSNVKEFIKHDE